MPTTTPARQRYYNATGGDYESERYGDSHMGGYRAFRNRTLQQIIESRFADRSLKILEVGCGTGLSLEFLAQSPHRYSLFGVDASETMLRQAAQKAAALENGAKLALGDASRLPYVTGRFDVVFATRFIHQFAHDIKCQLWQELQRVTRPGGLVVVEFYARPYHWLRYYLGGKKGRSKDAYLSHFPTRSEVKNIVGDTHEIYPLRLPGSRVLSALLGEPQLQRMTNTLGRGSHGLFLDEYFVAAQRR